MPTRAKIEAVLACREVGARLAHGPWMKLGPARWGVPALAYLSLEPLGDLVIVQKAGRWVAERGHGSDVNWRGGR